MNIEKVPDDVLITRVHLAEAALPNGEQVNISISGSDLIIEMKHEFYSISMESIVKDVIDFSEQGD